MHSCSSIHLMKQKHSKHMMVFRRNLVQHKARAPARTSCSKSTASPNVKREDVDDKMVFEVTLVRAREALKVYIARNQTGVACVKESAGTQ